jgi:hypothetical protein
VSQKRGSSYVSAMGAGVPTRDVPGDESPSLDVIGSVWEHTLTGGCWWGKQFGATDGFTFMGISVPISNRSA